MACALWMVHPFHSFCLLMLFIAKFVQVSVVYLCLIVLHKIVYNFMLRQESYVVHELCIVRL